MPHLAVGTRREAGLWRRAAAAVLGLCMLGLDAAGASAGFLEHSIEFDGRTHRYQVYVPDSLVPAKRPPVILWLHGTGERGDDGEKPTHMGLGPAIRAHPRRFPAIAVFPQAPDGEWWQGRTAALAMAVLDRTIEEFRADTNRVYLAGASMGGTGAWYLASRHADRFAALVVICGRIAPHEVHADAEPVVPPSEGAPEQAIARRLARLPVWLWHGADDPVVPAWNSRRAHRALRQRRAPVRYTELDGVGHGAWEAAWADPALTRWLFAQAQQREPKSGP